MSERIRTSTVIDALLAVDTRLRSLSLPASGSTNRLPQVYFLDSWSKFDTEFVHLVGKVPDNEVDHAGMGPSTREETYQILIRCGTTIRGKDAREALDRLKQISTVVEAAFRSPTTGQPIPPDLDGAEIARGGIERFEVDAYMTDQGVQAIADIYFRVIARI